MNPVHDNIEGYDCGCKKCYNNRSLNVRNGYAYRTVRSPLSRYVKYRTTHALYVADRRDRWMTNDQLWLESCGEFCHSGTDVVLCVDVIDDYRKKFYYWGSSLGGEHSFTLVRCVSKFGVVYVFGGDLIPMFTDTE